MHAKPHKVDWRRCLAQSPKAIKIKQVPQLNKKTARVSVLIVSYNTMDMTLACIASVREFANSEEQEIIVIDNASTDGSADAIAKIFPDIHLVRSSVNLGFAGANNLAAHQASAPFILLLNPDTLILDNGITRLLDFAQRNPEAGIWGGRTFFADMSLNPSSVWRFMSLWSLCAQAFGFSKIMGKSRFWSPESYGGWARNSVREVDIVTGCFFLIKRKLWEKLGGFDQQFFMYAEEADLCFRARKLGARALFTPDATIIHYGGASETVRADKIKRLYTGKCTFILKHMSAWKASIAVSLLKWHAAVRWFGYATVFRVLKSPHMGVAAEQWRSVWRSRNEWSRGYPAQS